MKTTIDMAREVYGAHTEWSGAPLDRLEQLVALVRADQDEKYKWDIHSCGPTCTKAACVAMREAVEAEREACAKVCEDDAWRCKKIAVETQDKKANAAALEAYLCAEAIRARGNI
jgi:predicted amidohydrolase YtcJ